ncbi:hypothetical protein TNIN_292901 [Trichonephila inaurata madagascariensis]|uniref:C2H2-type domain-containing protein n=1 Tax=Trichonephila inaurata madagascariensis TaxID=2747483 RepID=A0A8X7BQA9_9ARAC|nr:hypothetical protein TNIN_292901 [Trichonephila inaurata madagascariensis]
MRFFSSVSLPCKLQNCGDDYFAIGEEFRLHQFKQTLQSKSQQNSPTCYLKCESSENKVSTSLELFDYFNSDVDHNLNSYYYCSLYPYSTTRINQIKRHSGKHNGVRPFTCDTCGKSFTKKWHHKIHMRVHTGEKPYECPYCPSKFSDPSAFRRHQAVHKVSLS